MDVKNRVLSWVPRRKSSGKFDQSNLLPKNNNAETTVNNATVKNVRHDKSGNGRPHTKAIGTPSSYPVETLEFIYLSVWTIINIAFFILTFIDYAYSDQFAATRSILGASTLSISRASSVCINLNAGILLLPTCRTLISVIRERIPALNRYIPFDSAPAFHRLLSWNILLFTFIHVYGHYISFALYADTTANTEFYISPTFMAISHPTGITGQLLVILTLLIITSSISPIRESFYKIFLYTHQLSWLLWFVLLLVHGSFCFTKSDSAPFCQPSSFWKFWLASGLIYALERGLRYYKIKSEQTYISKVIAHPSNIVELQIKKPGTKINAGRVYFNCPEVSVFEWYPFVMTSCSEEDFISIHMLVKEPGSWSRQVAERLGVSFESKQSSRKDTIMGVRPLKVLPRFYVDGPYGNFCADIFNHPVAVCIGIEKDAIPFASILKSVWFKSRTLKAPHTGEKNAMVLQKLYFIWVVKDLTVGFTTF